MEDDQHLLINYRFAREFRDAIRKYFPLKVSKMDIDAELQAVFNMAKKNSLFAATYVLVWT